MDYLADALEMATRVVEQKQKNLVYRGFEHTGIQTVWSKSELLSLKIYRGVEYVGDILNYYYRHSNDSAPVKIYRGFQYV